MGLFFMVAVVSVVIGILYLAYLGFQCLQKIFCHEETQITKPSTKASKMRVLDTNKIPV